MPESPETNKPEWRGMNNVGRTAGGDYIVDDYFGGNCEELGKTCHKGLRGDDETIRYGRVIRREVFELITHVPD